MPRAQFAPSAEAPKSAPTTNHQQSSGCRRPTTQQRLWYKTHAGFCVRYSLSPVSNGTREPDVGGNPAGVGGARLGGDRRQSGAPEDASNPSLQERQWAQRYAPLPGSPGVGTATDASRQGEKGVTDRAMSEEGAPQDTTPAAQRSRSWSGSTRIDTYGSHGKPATFARADSINVSGFSGSAINRSGRRPGDRPHRKRGERRDAGGGPDRYAYTPAGPRALRCGRAGLRKASGAAQAATQSPPKTRE